MRNGLRCFVAWLIHEHGVPTEPITIQTDAGPQHCIPRVDSDGVLSGITVDLGPATFGHEQTVMVKDRKYLGTPMTLGNPHYVIPRQVEPDEAANYGPALSTHRDFPNGANIEWLAVRSQTDADLVVYERGAGLTLACGTGGGGAAATGVRLGLLAPDTELTVRLPGGFLMYNVRSDFSSVMMTGQTERVYEATLPIRL